MRIEDHRTGLIGLCWAGIENTEEIARDDGEDAEAATAPFYALLERVEHQEGDLTPAEADMLWPWAEVAYHYGDDLDDRYEFFAARAMQAEWPELLEVAEVGEGKDYTITLWANIRDTSETGALLQLAQRIQKSDLPLTMGGSDTITRDDEED